MTHHFRDITIGGVLIAPFVTYAGVALVVFLLARPVLRLVRFEELFSQPPVALLCVYLVILAILIVFF